MTLPLDIPTLHTDRLTLRAPREGDLAALVAYGASPRSHFNGGPFPAREAWRILGYSLGHWALRGYGYWSVDRSTDDAFLGRVGVIRSAEDPEPELAWQLFDGFEGHGYASEAAIAARDHAASLGLAPLVSIIDPENTRSLALATRLGATLEGEYFEDGKTYLAFRHPIGGRA